MVRQVSNSAVLRCKQLEDLVLVAEYSLVEEEIGLVLRQERLQLSKVHVLLQTLLGHGLVREVKVLLVRHEVVVDHLPLDSLRIHRLWVARDVRVERDGFLAAWVHVLNILADTGA